ncbi:hypothetical protein BC832DRAFT_275460 [Gaertneriomyces semiglobifer]|nr:hypothetical protein BC832DRAFT_275460 [Gaertneriomyces semiglobifer]
MSSFASSGLLARFRGMQNISTFSPTASLVRRCPNQTQTRLYTRHTWHTQQVYGLTSPSIRVTSSPAVAFRQLRAMTDESNIRSIVRSQERFEKKSDKRRRKKAESEWRVFVKSVRKKVRVAYELKKRTREEIKGYDAI